MHRMRQCGRFVKPTVEVDSIFKEGPGRFRYRGAHCLSLVALAIPFVYVMQPDRFDLWIVGRLGSLMGRHPLFDLGVQSSIAHEVLGGYWFAGVVFVLWTQKENLAVPQARQRIWTILAGSLLAVALVLICGQFLRWAPPNRNPSLVHYFPAYILSNANENSFPSASTALYGSIAAGVFSLCRPAGVALWVLVFGAVGLPRMYVGGHYASDVVVGAALGLVGYFAARSWIEPRIPRWMAGLSNRFHGARWLGIAGETVLFVWILQLAVEFREFVWATHILDFLMGRGHLH